MRGFLVGLVEGNCRLIGPLAALLNLHRAYFAVALDERPTELSSHRYVPSVLATYRSAWRLGKSLQLVWAKYPDSISRVGLMWSQGLSAAVSLFHTTSQGMN